jgi:hypothetical protein
MVALTLAPQAFATAELKISDGTNTIDILDNGAGVCTGAVTGCADANGGVNQVTFVGTIGTWTLNVSTGSSHGASVGTDLDLNSVNSTTAASTLTIRFSDDGFSTPAGHTFSVGGTLQGAGSISFSEYAAAAKFGTTNPIGLALNFGPGPFSGTTGSGVVAGGALTEVAVLTFTGPGSTSFNGALTPVPEPASVALFGGVLLFSVTLMKKKLQKS